jgi:microcystin-dependent protein
MKKLVFGCTLLLSIASTSVLKAQASEPFLGQIAFVPYNFVPKTGLPVTDSFYQFRKIRLYLLLGTTYGGNGTTTFALPDMREEFWYTKDRLREDLPTTRWDKAEEQNLTPGDTNAASLTQ